MSFATRFVYPVERKLAHRKMLKKGMPALFLGKTLRWHVMDPSGFLMMNCFFDGGGTVSLSVLPDGTGQRWGFVHKKQDVLGNSFPLDEVADFLTTLQDIDLLEAHMYAQDLNDLFLAGYHALTHNRKYRKSQSQDCGLETL